MRDLHGLLAMALIFDIIHLATGVGYWSEIAYWMIAAGIIGGLVAAPFSLINWLAIPTHTRAKRIGAWRGGELADRLSVGVDPGSHVDAPSSLRSRGAA